MNRVFALSLGLFVFCWLCWAQQSPASPNNNAQRPEPQVQPGTPPSSGQTLRVAPGSVIPAELTKTIDAKKAKPGDEVIAKVTQDMKAQNAEVIVAKDTKIVGHITAAQAHTKEQKESELGIAFDHAVMRDGNIAPLPMSIQAIIAPAALNPGNGGNAAAAETGQPSAPPSSRTMSGNDTGRPSGMGNPPPAPGSSAPGGELPNEISSAASAHQPITGETRGVVGISNLTLTAGSNASQGSELTSEKGNVKLESGTLLLLRVSQ